MKAAIAALALWVACTVAYASNCGPRDASRADDRIMGQLVDALGPDETAYVSHHAGPWAMAPSIAAAELLRKRADAAGVDADARAIAVWNLLDGYLDLGFSDEAIALFESLDTPTRERITRGRYFAGSAFACGKPNNWSQLYFSRIPNRTDAALAVAYAAHNDMARADELLRVAHNRLGVDDVPPVDSQQSEDAGECAYELIHATPQTDWFRWVFVPNSRVFGGGHCNTAVSARDYQRMAAQHIAKSDMPEAWRFKMARYDAHVIENDPAEITALKDGAWVRERIAQVSKRLAALDGADAPWMTPPPKDHAGIMSFGIDNTEEPASAADRKLAASINERISHPLFNPYHSMPVPKTSGAIPSPCAKYVLRCADVDGVHWEIRISYDYDSTGGVLPTGGYWLQRTPLPDGEPRSYYLDLRQHSPYELVDSDAPFIVDGELRLRVHRSELDPASITLPATSLRFDAGGVEELRASLADIMKDSDGDGLTDLAEQRLLLDPHNPDTDGDGVPDGIDSTPNVADTPPTPRQGAFSAALAFVVRDSDPPTTTRAAHDERTIFLMADPADVAHIAIGQRIIVVPKSVDFERLRQRPGFGSFFATHVAVKMLDDTHAEGSWGAGAGGGTLLLDFRDGVWRVGTLASWVS